MQHTLAILSTENEYACCLMEFLNQQEDFLFCARSFSNTTAYMEFEKQHTVDVLLFDQSIPADQISLTQAKIVLYLSENPRETSHEGRTCIFMYQSAKRLMELTISEYESAGHTLPDYSKTLQTNIFGVCSAAGGSRQSVFALALADAYAKNQKTLLISLQPFITSEIFQKEEKAALSEAIYILKQEEGNKSSKIKDLVEHYGALDYLLGIEHFSDLSEITKEELMELFSILKNHCSYDIVIIDLPVLTKGLNDWLEQCMTIYEPAPGDSIDEQIQRQFHKQLELQETSLDELKFMSVDCSQISQSEDTLTIQAIRTGAWGELARQYCQL